MGDILAVVAASLLVAAMLVTNMRYLRFVALAAGLAAVGHFAIAGETGLWFALSVAFVLANLMQLWALLARARRGNLPAEERELLEHVLKVEEPDSQRRLLDLFEWKDVAAGQLLMQQGEAEPPLVYVASGKGRVEHDGKVIGACGAGDFLGEMSAVSGERASASIHADTDMRIARFDRDALYELTRQMPEMRRAFDHALNRSLAAKLVRMNTSATGGE